MTTIYWTCTRESTDARREPFEHRRLNVTYGDQTTSRAMWDIWRTMCGGRRAREAIVVRVWEGTRMIGEWVANDVTAYPRPAVHVLAQVVTRNRQREVSA